MEKLHQQELLEWAEAAVKELNKLNHDRGARCLRDGGKALIKEIEKEKAAHCNEQQTA